MRGKRVMVNPWYAKIGGKTVNPVVYTMGKNIFRLIKTPSALFYRQGLQVPAPLPRAPLRRRFSKDGNVPENRLRYYSDGYGSFVCYYSLNQIPRSIPLPRTGVDISKLTRFPMNTPSISPRRAPFRRSKQTVWPTSARHC